MNKLKQFFSSKINISALIIVLISIQSQFSGLDLAAMTIQSWITFAIGILIIIFRSTLTGVVKGFFASKINWSAIVIILTSLQSQVDGLDFGKMTPQAWSTFTLGILIIVFRTYFTSPSGDKPTE